MTNKTKAAIEEAAKQYFRYDPIPGNGEVQKVIDVYCDGMEEVIEHPERYELTARKPLGIQEASELFDQAFTEQISFSRFIELINEGGTK